MRTAVFLIAAISLCPAEAPAQDAGEQLPERVYTTAKLVDASPPRFPTRAAREGREGWVILSYIVTADGEIDSPMIEDSSGGEDFERAALRALEDWVYEPATLNGTPTAQSLTNSRVLFVLEGGSNGVSRRFSRSYTDIADLIEAGDLESADELLVDLTYSEKHNLYEDAWFWWLKFQHMTAVGTSSDDELRQALRRALGYEQVYLVPDLFVAASLELYRLQVKHLDFSSAIRTFERMRDSDEAKKSEVYDRVVTGLNTSYEGILALVAGEQTLALNGRIGANGYWVHRLLRRDFYFDDVDGSVELVDIRCGRGNAQYPFSGENTWHVPDSWGNCGLYIKGDEGASFVLYELPSEP